MPSPAPMRRECVHAHACSVRAITLFHQSLQTRAGKTLQRTVINLVRAQHGFMETIVHRRAGSFRPAIMVMILLLTLAAAPAPHAAETQLSIRITPRAAALIAALQRGVAPSVALSSLPRRGSGKAFVQSCNAAGGAASIARTADSMQRVCT